MSGFGGNQRCGVRLPRSGKHSHGKLTARQHLRIAIIRRKQAADEQARLLLTAVKHYKLSAIDKHRAISELERLRSLIERKVAGRDWICAYGLICKAARQAHFAAFGEQTTGYRLKTGYR